ncbi:MAG: hypothetical protein IKI44_01990 [Bacteroidaceae bacterium]|nr:hypothetical protein [Bacteroidaceae bacterium]
MVIFFQKNLDSENIEKHEKTENSHLKENNWGRELCSLLRAMGKSSLGKRALHSRFPPSLFTCSQESPHPSLENGFQPKITSFHSVQNVCSQRHRTYPSKAFKRYLQSLAADILLERSVTVCSSSVASGDSLPFVGPQPHSVAALKTPVAPGIVGAIGCGIAVLYFAVATLGPICKQKDEFAE